MAEIKDGGQNQRKMLKTQNLFFFFWNDKTSLFAFL